MQSNTAKLISIIIPCYNCENFIQKTIESLNQQTIKDFEVIIINDGSTDNSLLKIKKLLSNSKLDYNILNQNNAGVSIARNIGIEKAKGKYIYFLDSDDYIESNWCEKLDSIINSYDLDMIFFNYNVIIGEKRKVNTNLYDDYYKVKDSSNVIKEVLSKKFNYHICATIIKKEIIINNLLTFTPNSKYGEDHEFLIKALSKSKNVMIIPDSLFNYCIRTSSATGSFTKGRLDSIYSALRVYKYICENYYNSEIINLSKAYVADKIIGNFKAYIMLADTNDVELCKNMYDILTKYKYYFKYYKYDRKTIKAKVVRCLLSCFPELYFKMFNYKINFRKVKAKNEDKKSIN